MTELNFYRFVMFWLLLAVGVIAVRQYGDYRVERFLANQAASIQPVLPQTAMDRQVWTVPPQAVPSHVPSAFLAPAYTSLNQVPAHAPSSDPVAALPDPLPPTGNDDPPVIPVVSNADATDPVGPAVAEIESIRQMLGGSQVARILSDKAADQGALDVEQVFRDKLRQLQASQSGESSAAWKPTADEGLAPQEPGRVAVGDLTSREILEITRHLELLAGKLKLTDPDKSDACHRMARRVAKLQVGTDEPATRSR